MPSWSNLDTVGRPSAGGALLTAWGDAVDDDMNLLAQSPQVVGVGGAVWGTAPSVSTPVYKLQGGYASGTTSAGGIITITYPVVFATAAIWANVEIYFNAGTTAWKAQIQSVNNSAIAFNLWNMSTNATVPTQAVNYMWIVLGS